MDTNIKFKTISRDNIYKMVMTFYAHILGSNNSVSDVFISKLGDNLNSAIWKKHIELLTNFWATMILQEEGYDGNPVAKHIDMPLNKESFSVWLDMFFEVIDDLYEKEAGAIFKQRAVNISQNFINKLNITD
jgi:hemoglobin